MQCFLIMIMAYRTEKHILIQCCTCIPTSKQNELVRCRYNCFTLLQYLLLYTCTLKRQRGTAETTQQKHIRCGEQVQQCTATRSTCRCKWHRLLYFVCCSSGSAVRWSFIMYSLYTFHALFFCISILGFFQINPSPTPHLNH
jgi:hypothetical protein